jgi:hypothetical protein
MYHRFLLTAWLASKKSNINEYPASRQYICSSELTNVCNFAWKYDCVTEDDLDQLIVGDEFRLFYTTRS